MKKKFTKPEEKPEEAVDKLLQEGLKQQEKQQLIFGPDLLLPQRPKNDREEQYQLRSGYVFTKRGVADLLEKGARDYFPMFPNEKPFFKLMFNLNGWKGNPNEFFKPPAAALYIKQYIYARFPKDMLPTLLTIDNPIVSGYIRKYKLFQFLNDEGIEMMEDFIDQAIEVMKDSKDWYDFEKKYCAKYQLSLQLKLLPGY